MKQFTRRSFITSSLCATTALSVGTHPFSQHGAPDQFTILFHGDSITDGNRGRNADLNHILGHGYAFSIASTLGSKYPERNLNFINKGISGDKVSSLLARWQNDTIELRPDLLSILVGINDVHAAIHGERVFDSSNLETEYRQLLNETRRKLPNTTIVLGEPFILPVGMVNTNPGKWTEMTKVTQNIVRAVAKDFNAIFIPFQKMFNNACGKAPAEYWIWDGIHPTYAGHGLMSTLWLETVGKTVTRVALD